MRNPYAFDVEGGEVEGGVRMRKSNRPSKAPMEFNVLSLDPGMVTGGLIKVSFAKFWIEKPMLVHPSGFFHGAVEQKAISQEGASCL